MVESRFLYDLIFLYFYFEGFNFDIKTKISKQSKIKYFETRNFKYIYYICLIIINYHNDTYIVSFNQFLITNFNLVIFWACPVFMNKIKIQQHNILIVLFNLEDFKPRAQTFLNTC